MINNFSKFTIWQMRRFSCFIFPSDTHIIFHPCRVLGNYLEARLIMNASRRNTSSVSTSFYGITLWHHKLLEFLNVSSTFYFQTIFICVMFGRWIFQYFRVDDYFHDHVGDYSKRRGRRLLYPRFRIEICAICVIEKPYYHRFV